MISAPDDTGRSITAKEPMTRNQLRYNNKISRLYDLVSGDEDARVCRDIPAEACREIPANFFIQLISSAVTKLADELASAKLVLPWLLTALAAPAFLTGFLVPIRESGSLLPQLIVAGFMRRYPRRKWFWVVGSLGQGIAVILMAVVAMTMRGVQAGWLIVVLLIAFSLSRGVCSVAGKDVMGKTVSKARRGTMMGYAGAVAGVITILVGAYLKTRGSAPQMESLVYGMLIAAAALWLLAAAVYSRVGEIAGATSGGANALTEAVRSFGLLRSDRGFRSFVITRTLLLSTALAMPFYVVLGEQQVGPSLSGLGLMVVASGLAASISAPIWGRLADRSSRLVLAAGAGLAGGLGLIVFGLTALDIPAIHNNYTFAVFFLIMGVAHSGVRLGRKTYLIDLATPEKRPAYVALSNTIIGIAILFGGISGVVAQFAGTRYIILLLSLVALTGAIKALKLQEVE